MSATDSLDDLLTGHIVVCDPVAGLVRTLYRPESHYNFLFATEQCNSNCLMCSQPPKDIDDCDELTARNLRVIELIREAPSHLTITGGEPTLLGPRLLALFAALKRKLPSTRVHVLSNGRRFADSNFCSAVAELQHPLLSFGVPVYADVPWIHDYVVQASGAFAETERGLLNLARWGQHVEVRVVLHKQTVLRLERLAQFIYRNFTFADHVAFMGLEHVGFAVGNMKNLWVDPADYQEELLAAVGLLDRSGIPVSIYNVQHCALPVALRHFARKSISDWKNSYLPACEGCPAKEDCCGFFSWNTSRLSRKFGPLV